jgi:hypothetical protein
MSLVLAAGHRANLLTTPPPKEIAGTAAARSGLGDDLDDDSFTASWVALHAGYGAGSGALFRLVRPWLPAPSPLAGLLFGGLVWAGSYLGLMPALGLYPWPREDRQSRMLVMIVAHAVYGVVTAVLGDRLDAEAAAPGAASTARTRSAEV